MHALCSIHVHASKAYATQRVQGRHSFITLSFLVNPAFLVQPESVALVNGKVGAEMFIINALIDYLAKATLPIKFACLVGRHQHNIARLVQGLEAQIRPISRSREQRTRQRNRRTARQGCVAPRRDNRHKSSRRQS